MYAFEKNPQRGRPKGSPNKSTTKVKSALEATFDGIGGVENLIDWAKANPTEFYKLWAKMLPLQVQADLKHSGAVTIIVETGISRAPDQIEQTA